MELSCLVHLCFPPLNLHYRHRRRRRRRHRLHRCHYRHRHHHGPRAVRSHAIQIPRLF